MNVRTAAPVLLCALAAMLFAAAQTPFRNGLDYKPLWPVKQAGKTVIQQKVGDAGVVVTMVTTAVKLDFGSKSPPRYVQCTYGRQPCSLTNLIRVAINGHDLIVPREAYAGLGDINTMAIAGTPDHLMLVFNGGDAAASYDARFVFNRTRLLECAVYMGEADYPPPVYDIHFNLLQPFAGR